MDKRYLADAVTLDSVWLRRIRGKLEAGEILRAKELADEDIKVWLRQLYGFESDSHDTLETITVSDTDDTPLDVATIVIDDLFHKTTEILDRLTNPDYVRLVDIAELMASYYLIQWGDFMGDSADADGSPQQTTINNSMRRMKLEVERLGSIKTSEEEETYPSTRFYFQKVTVLNRSSIVSRRRERR